jgi:hypothetical protein
VGALCLLIAVLGHERPAPEGAGDAQGSPVGSDTCPEPTPYSL